MYSSPVRPQTNYLPQSVPLQQPLTCSAFAPKASCPIPMSACGPSASIRSACPHATEWKAVEARQEMRKTSGTALAAKTQQTCKGATSGAMALSPSSGGGAAGSPLMANKSG